MAASKVLITGGAGFIGLHLAQVYLSRGYHVDLADNFSRAVQDKDLEETLLNPACKILKADLLSDHAFDSFDRDYEIIVHFAAILGVANVLEKPYRVLTENTEMTARAIEFARENKKLKRFVFASTSEVYAGTLENFTLPLPTPESTPLALTKLDHPRTSYMLSKIYGEAMSLHSGLPVTIIRPHNVYGPRMGLSHVVPELLKKAYTAKDGDSIDVFSVDHRRTFCFVSDAVEMIARATESEKCRGQTLNIGNESPEITIGELAEAVVKTVGRKLKLNPKPATPGSPSRRCPEMKKTTELTGYRAQISVSEGVKRTFDWYRKNVFDGGGISAR